MTPTDYFSCAPRRRVRLLSLLVLCIDVSAAATIQLGQSLAEYVDATSSTTTLNATAGHYYCSRQAEFVTDTFEISDCLTAIEKLRRVEETAHNMHLYEFREPHSHREHKYPTQTMPRKYVSGTCMVELVMMRDTSLDDVEGRGLVSTYKYADVASYYEIWRQSVRLAETCLAHFGIPGLITAGRFHSIGVFLWAVNSTMAERIPAFEPADFASTS